MPMTFSDRIELDVKCLRKYFEQLFSMAKEFRKIQPVMPINDKEDAWFVGQNVTNFIRPNMVCNVYSLVDFWLKELCSFHEKKANLSLKYKDIKSNKSDLDAYHKYLTKVALLDLKSMLPSFRHLGSLRKARNCFIHGGGHVEKEMFQKIAHIPDISVMGSLVVVSDDFIWNSLNHAQTYLVAVARA
jgi:hypothetical protein